jgi:hypothetical protein
MAKFTYRMQNILDIKIKLENQAKIAYATASRQLAEEQEKLREILMRRAGYEKIKRAGQRDAGYPGDPGMQARDRRDEESAESTDDEGARRGKDVGDGANRTEPGDGGAKDA